LRFYPVTEAFFLELRLLPSLLFDAAPSYPLFGADYSFLSCSFCAISGEGWETQESLNKEGSKISAGLHILLIVPSFTLICILV
jgi:hypothetical protein